MKKQFSIFALLFGIALIAELCFFLPEVKAQVKIGDITITDSTAKEYFLWCYQNPDTTWFFNYSTSKIQTEKDDREIERKLKKAKNFIDSLNARMDNSSSSVRVVSNTENKLSSNNIGQVYKDKIVDSDLTDHYTGYLTKREPTAQGFLEWFIKKARQK